MNVWRWLARNVLSCVQTLKADIHVAVWQASNWWMTRNLAQVMEIDHRDFNGLTLLFVKEIVFWSFYNLISVKRPTIVWSLIIIRRFYCVLIVNHAPLSYNNLRRWLSLSSDLAECDTVNWGVNCNQSCDCTQNSISCDSKFGCQCKDGWSGTQCEVNIDECVGGGPCGGLENCVDTPGSYVCQCKAGYLRNQTTGNCESRSYNFFLQK